MLKIWGRRDSFNLQKVMWCVAELGIAHQRIDAGGRHGVTDTPEYRAMNPNGRVPTIDESECVGCNLCEIVCPVPECITMQAVDNGYAPATWNQHTATGATLRPKKGAH